MNYGFVKVAAAVPHVKVADCKFNVEKIESLIAVAEGKGVQIIVLHLWRPIRPTTFVGRGRNGADANPE